MGEKSVKNDKRMKWRVELSELISVRKIKIEIKMKIKYRITVESDFRQAVESENFLENINKLQ